MSDRPSLPPGDESLRAMTAQYTAVNDRHEAALASLVTDEHRLAVARELWRMHVAIKGTHMDQTLHTFEREARERLAKGAGQ